MKAEFTSEYTIGEKLRYYREACAMSQQQVADALNLNRTSITKYETDIAMPSLETVVKMAKIYNVEPQALLPLRDNPGTVTYRDSASIGSPIFQLSKDERGLLALYRGLDKEQKAQLRAAIANIAKKTKE